jgi:predicted phage baseplate assembly protein
LAAVSLVDDEGARWTAVPDLLASGAEERVFLAEIDNDGVARLRFGDGELGRAPDVGARFTADYRVGGGRAGNVGGGAICRLVLGGASIEGIDFTVGNPLAAAGGIDPEPLAQAKLHAPTAFRRTQRRAVTAANYAEIAARNPALQRAAAQLVWTGSWWEAVVAVDPFGQEIAPPALLAAIADYLNRYRRIGHDLRVRPAVYVPITLGLEICLLPGYDRGDLRQALLARLVGAHGLFQPDRLSFGEGVYLSRIVAEAMAVSGVASATVTALHRRFQPPNGELETGVLPLGPYEIAQLANDHNHPERGQLELTVRGGR